MRLKECVLCLRDAAGNLVMVSRFYGNLPKTQIELYGVKGTEMSTIALPAVVLLSAVALAAAPAVMLRSE
jgi:hypothetical protein